jgi:hypothetical protein
VVKHTTFVSVAILWMEEEEMCYTNVRFLVLAIVFAMIACVECNVGNSDARVE